MTQKGKILDYLGQFAAHFGWLCQNLLKIGDFRKFGNFSNLHQFDHKGGKTDNPAVRTVCSLKSLNLRVPDILQNCVL